MSLHFGQSHEKEMELQLSKKIQLFVHFTSTQQTKKVEKRQFHGFFAWKSSDLFWSLKMDQKCKPSGITMKNFMISNLLF